MLGRNLRTTFLATVPVFLLGIQGCKDDAMVAVNRDGEPLPMVLQKQD